MSTICQLELYGLQELHGLFWVAIVAKLSLNSPEIASDH